MAYYDPVSYAPVADDQVTYSAPNPDTGVTGGYLYRNAGGDFVPVQQGEPDANAYFSNWNNFQGGQTTFGNDLQKMATQYGWTPQDIQRGYNSYLESQGLNPYSESGQNGRGVAQGWWGPQKTLQGILTGLGREDLVNQYVNPSLRDQQQQNLATEGTNSQNSHWSDMSDLADVAAGVGTILGAGFGLNGLYGAGGLGGTGVSAAGTGGEWVSGMDLAGGGDAAGAGWVSGSDLPTGGAAGGSTDSTSMIGGGSGGGSSPGGPDLPAIGGEPGGAAPQAGGASATPDSLAGGAVPDPMGGTAPGATTPSVTPNVSGIDLGGGAGAPTAPATPDPMGGTAPGANAPTGPVDLSQPSGAGAGAGRSVGPGGVMPAPEVEMSTTAPISDQVRLGTQGMLGGNNGTGSLVQKALNQLGITDKEGGVGKNALSLAGLGLSQYNASKSKNNLSSQLKEAGAGSSAAAKQLLDQGLAGQAPAAIMAAADKTMNDGINEINQRYANMGRDAKTDTGAQAEISKLKVARDAQIAQYAQNMVSQGLQASQIAQGPTTQAAVAAANDDKALSQSISQMLQQMAMIQAMQGKQ